MKSDEFLDDVRLRREILQHIKYGKYRLTKHAAEEQVNGNLDLQDTLRVLKTGTHELAKGSSRNKFPISNYVKVPAVVRSQVGLYDSILTHLRSRNPGALTQF